MRVAWLLNHRTLMPFECSWLTSFGHEVFVPKVVPAGANEFRSTIVNYQFDDTLSISADNLEYLNSVNLYTDKWSTRTINIFNENFDVIITAMYEVPFLAALDSFRGAIVLRVFGLVNGFSYSQIINHHFGKATIDKIISLGSRFIFCPAYPEILENEGLALRATARTVPVGMMSSGRGRRWQGGGKFILFVCPNINDSPYYGAVFNAIKRDFVGFDILIFGTQENPVDDPRVKGWISSDEFSDLMSRCAAFIYISGEKRHLHYTPIEAMSVGVPVIFNRSGLLASFFYERPILSYSGIDEARVLASKAIDGAIGGNWIKQQENVVHQFSYDYITSTSDQLFANFSLV